MSDTSKRILLWGSVILGMFLLVFALAKLGTSTGTTRELSVAIHEEDNKKGATNPTVTLVEYSDFQCPACAQYYPMVKQLASEFPDDLQVVYRHYPLVQIHKNAQSAAYAAEAAGKQGKFWDMHDMLFNTQNVWSPLENPNEQFEKYAQSLGLNIDTFKADSASKEVRDRVQRDVSGANSMNIGGTPSFFLDGTYIQNPASYESFKKLVEDRIGQ